MVILRNPFLWYQDGIGRTIAGPFSVEGQKFKGGRLAITAGVMEMDDVFVGILQLLARHMRGDWGDLGDHDRLANEQALEHGARLMSVYNVGGREIWIITEAGRHETTILLPSEY